MDITLTLGKELAEIAQESDNQISLRFAEIEHERLVTQYYRCLTRSSVVMTEDVAINEFPYYNFSVTLVEKGIRAGQEFKLYTLNLQPDKRIRVTDNKFVEFFTAN